MEYVRDTIPETAAVSLKREEFANQFETIKAEHARYRDVFKNRFPMLRSFIFRFWIRILEGQRGSFQIFEMEKVKTRDHKEMSSIFADQ